MRETKNTYEATHRSITDVTSHERENLLLTYGHSDRETYSVLGFQVVRTIRRIERVSDLVTINAGNNEDFAVIGEDGWGNNVSNPGDDVFRIDSERKRTLVEYGFGVDNDGVYVAMQTADGDAINGIAESSERDRGFSVGDIFDRGGVLSDLTTIGTPGVSDAFPVPTTALSPNIDQGVIRIDSREDGLNSFRFAFDNQSGSQQTIDVIGYGTAYHVRPITSEDTVRSLLSNTPRNTRVVTLGGFGTNKPNLPQDWYPHRVFIRAGELVPGGG
jgi:hypothetical protein